MRRTFFAFDRKAITMAAAVCAALLTANGVHALDGAVLSFVDPLYELGK